MEYKFEGIPDSYWVAGFTSGDGSFNIKTTRTNLKRIQLRFSIILHKRELEVIKGIAKYFNKLDYEDKGVINNKNYVGIQIVNFTDIFNIIIPFFEKYPIEGSKKLDFEDFKFIANMLNNKEHLTEEGLKKILEIKKGMNLKRK